MIYHKRFVVNCCHAAEGPSAAAVVAVRRPYATRIEEQVVNLRSRNSSTRPVVGALSKAAKRRATHAAGTDKVVRISINECIAIRSVDSIGRAAKVCAGGKNEGVTHRTLKPYPRSSLPAGYNTPEYALRL